MSDTGYFGGQEPIPFESDRHRTILDALNARKESHISATQILRDRWQRDEEQYIGYITPTALDERRKMSKDFGVPEFETIHVPYNYAMLMAAHTYFTSVLFARDPIWQVKGRHGETQQKEMAWEALLSYQVLAGRHMPNYYIWTHDPLRYGYGVLGHYWCKDMVNVTRIDQADRTFLGEAIPGKSKRVTVIQSMPTYQGTKTYNVHPRDFGWDPRFPVGRFQEGEFCFRSFEMSKLDILQARVPGDKPRFFNLEAVKPISKGTGGTTSSGPDPKRSSVLDIPRQDHTEAGYTLEVVNLPVDEYYVRLNPKVWGLKGPDRIEKWVFLVVDEKVIISAQPLGLMHDMFPFAITQGEVEGYDRSPRGVLHTTEALNDTLNWLINSHFYNVRAALNDKFIVDPSRIVMADLMGPNAGRVVRLKPEFYGTDLDKLIKQVPVADVTRSNVQDLGVVGDMMQRAIGVNDTIMGTVNTGRRTATEVRSSTTLGINRLKTLVEYNSACAFDPHVLMLIATTQQMMDFEMQLKVVGDLAQTSGDIITVDPSTIGGFYDFVPVDGTLPIDRMAQVNMWTQLLQAGAAVPGFLQGFDLAGIFAFVAQLAGIRNINRFKLNVLPPGMAPPGNVIPLPSPGAGRGLDNSGAPVGPQMPGMGPTL